MNLDVIKPLERADQNWEFGRLKNARAGYAAVLDRDPNNWHAAFQIAWIDSAFAPLEERRVEALRRYDLSTRAAESLDRLADRARAGSNAHLLDGGLDAWDIEALRSSSGEKSNRWWEDRAAKAAAALQYGLAMACYAEAEQLSPELYFDPPPGFKATTHPRTHLSALRVAPE